MKTDEETMRRPVPPMTPKLLRLAAELLDKAGARFSNHGCADFQLPDWITDTEAIELDLNQHIWNGDPEEHEPTPRRCVADWSMMHFLAEVLREATGEEPEIDVDAVRKRMAAQALADAEASLESAERARQAAEDRVAKAAESLAHARAAVI